MTFEQFKYVLEVAKCGSFNPLIVKVVVSKNLYSCFDRLSDIVLYLT